MDGTTADGCSGVRIRVVLVRGGDQRSRLVCFLCRTDDSIPHILLLFASIIIPMYNWRGQQAHGTAATVATAVATW